MKQKIQILEDARCLARPAWTQYDLFAFNHKHLTNGKTLKDYYIKLYKKTLG